MKKLWVIVISLLLTVTICFADSTVISAAGADNSYKIGDEADAEISDKGGTETCIASNAEISDKDDTETHIASNADELVNNLEKLIDEIIASQQTQAGAADIQNWIDTSLTENAGTAAQWYILALSRYNDDYDYAKYTAALQQYMEQNTVSGAVEQQKNALTFLAAGYRSSFITTAMDNTIGEQGIMSWIFGLHLLNNQMQSADFTAQEVIDQLLALRLTDGGWAISGKASDTDVTAMALQTLAPYYAVDDRVTEAIDQAVELLSNKQLADGSFASYGIAGPESIAQVITALAALDIDCLTDKRFIKNDNNLLEAILQYQLADNSFCHVKNGDTSQAATVQALYSLVALWRQQTSQSSLYSFGIKSLADLPEADTLAVTAEVQPPDGSGDNPSPNNTNGETTKNNSDLAVQQNDLDTDQPQNDSEKKAGSFNYKTAACLTILVLAVIACLILFVKGKRHIKNYIFILLLALLLAGLVCGINIQSRQDYYNSGTGSSVNSETDSSTENSIKATITIRCDSVIGKSTASYIPQDGVILDTAEFSIQQGATVYDLLLTAVKKNQIQMEAETDAFDSLYIAGLNYLYEFAFGDLSGWLYFVNGESASVGCSQYVLTDGDRVEWQYSCDLGNDLTYYTRRNPA